MPQTLLVVVLALGAALCIAIGVAAVLTKEVVHLVSRGIVSLVTSFELYALIVVAVAAITLQQSAFQVGAFHASLPATTVMEPVVAAMLGLLVLAMIAALARTSTDDLRVSVS